MPCGAGEKRGSAGRQVAGPQQQRGQRRNSGQQKAQRVDWVELTTCVLVREGERGKQLKLVAKAGCMH
jgi:hypothetical protein